MPIRKNLLLLKLCRRVLQLYCPHLKTHPSRISPKAIADHLLPALAAALQLDLDLISNEQRFYRTFRRGRCTKAMKEMLAIFYFHHTDAACREQAVAVYLSIGKKQTVDVMIYWNRFVEECLKEEKPKVPRIILYEPLYDSLNGLNN